MPPAPRLNQLRGNAHATASLAHRAFEHIAHAQLAADLLHINGLALVGEARIARDDEEPADAAERGDDLLDHAVSEILLLRVAAHIGERQHRNGRLVGEWQRRCCRGRCAFGGRVANPVNTHWPRDVFDLLLAQILEGEIEPVAHLIAHDAADANPARLRQRLQTRRDIHPVAVNVLALNDNVTEIDPYAELDALLGRHCRVALTHAALHRNRAAYCVDDARELDQEPVTGRLYDAPVML